MLRAIHITLVMLVGMAPLTSLSEEGVAVSNRSVSVALSSELYLEYGRASLASFKILTMSGPLLPGCKAADTFIQAIVRNPPANWDKKPDSEAKLDIRPVCLSCANKAALDREVRGLIKGAKLEGTFFEEFMSPPEQDMFGLHLDKGVSGIAEFSLTGKACWSDKKTRDADSAPKSKRGIESSGAGVELVR